MQVGAIIAALTLASLATQVRAADLDELKKLSISELTQLEVTSVSRSGEPLGGAAAAIAVVTNQDILRSGATSIPEVLRGVPGIHVGRRNANSWAVASRGFSSINSEKLLVLSDTRSIYTPLLSGVVWDVQNYVMEDIDRIEVIRGPGATQWGSNAVNGVINITTKSARDTQGLLLSLGGGSEDKALLSIRNGGRLGSGGHYRVFGQYFDRDASQLTDPVSPDDWHMAQLGFRADWERGDTGSFTLQGDWYEGRIGQIGPAVTIIGLPGPPPPLRARVRGGNVLGRWSHTTAAGANFELRAYFDRTVRNDPSFHDRLNTFDVDFQHRSSLAAHELTWGLNVRRTSNINRRKVIFAVDPPRANDMLYSGFVQDRIAIGDALHLTLGTKLEQNDFSGFEIQPSARLAWALPHDQTLWAAVSRAVRVPTRLERDVAIEVTPPASNPAAFLYGNPDYGSEKLIAYELGYRRQVSPRLALDVAAFHNDYQDLASLEFGTPFINPGDGRVIIPVLNQNMSEGRATGAELAANFSPVEGWQLAATYSFLDLEIQPNGLDINRGEFMDGATPRHQFGLRSSLDAGNLRLDGFLRRVGAIRREPQIVDGSGIAGYTELDLRAAWLWNRFEFALVLKNLLHEDHIEFGSPELRGGIERSVRAQLIWRPHD
jgi:iron complex outermembrane receptor protein